MTQTLPLAEVRTRFSELAEKVTTTHERIVITKNGRPICVLMAMDDLESMEETIDVLSVPGTAAAIEASEAEIAQELAATGTLRVTPREEVWAAYQAAHRV